MLGLKLNHVSKRGHWCERWDLIGMNVLWTGGHSHTFFWLFWWTHWPLREVTIIWSKIFKLVIQKSSVGTYREIAVKWMPQNLSNEESTSLRAWWHQATSHHLSWCWPRSMSVYGVTRPQCVNECTLDRWTFTHIFLIVLNDSDLGPVSISKSYLICMLGKSYCL